MKQCPVCKSYSTKQVNVYNRATMVFGSPVEPLLSYQECNQCGVHFTPKS